jgi:hypothetical protein
LYRISAQRLTLFFAGCLVGALPCNALAQEDGTSQEKDSSFFSFLDKPQKAISSRFETFVRRTDEFFANEKVFYDTTGSYIKLTGEVTYFEAGVRGYYNDFKIKARLPVTEKKVSLLLESNPGEEEEEIEKALQETPREAVQEVDYFAGVQTTLGEKRTWEIKPSLGVKLGDPIDYYTRLRITREVPLGIGTFQFKQAFYWFDSSGWESDTAAEFNFPFRNSLLLRSTSGINWQEQTDDADWPEDEYKISLRQIFSLTHKLSERRAISYQAGFYGDNNPHVHTTHYVLSTHYRQNLHDDYLFMDLIPRVTYRKQSDFQAEYSFTFRLEMVFKD